MKNKIKLLLITFMIIVSFSACKTGVPKDETKQAETNSITTISDREGNLMDLPAETRKIVSMAPSITQTLVSLGLSENIVAVDSYSAEIEGVKENIPLFDIMNPDTEQLAALKPDIIFATGMSKSDGDNPFKPITDLGITMTYIPSSTSIQEIKEDIRFIGDITNTKEKADIIVREMEKEIDEITSKIKESNVQKKVYFEIGAAPDIYSFGGNTFLTEIIKLLGGSNILADQKGWIPVSEEAIIAANPDIIFTNVNYIDDPVGEIKSRKGWDIIHAVKENKVYEIDNNFSSQPNENIIFAMKQMAQAIYPELFNE